LILDKIVDVKKQQLTKLKEEMSCSDIIKALDKTGVSKARDFKVALTKKNTMAVIAEVKKASPSKGIISKDFNPIEIAKEYQNAGAGAVSVLTETEFFLGSDQYLMDVKKTVSLPVLRKDFIIDEWQIYQAKLIGADAILLIAAILDDNKLSSFLKLAKELQLYCLVETHDSEEVKRVVQCGSEIIGINNRNLRTFEVSLDITEKLLQYIPRDSIKVSESGIKDNNDIIRLDKLGVDAVLIGETLMRSTNIGLTMKELLYG